MCVGEKQRMTSNHLILIMLTGFLHALSLFAKKKWHPLSGSLFCSFFSSCLPPLLPVFYILLSFPPLSVSLFYTPLLPNSLTSVCPPGLGTGAFPALAGPLTGRRARKTNMTGSRQGGLPPSPSQGGVRRKRGRGGAWWWRLAESTA